jgi:hypothetical protein
MESGNAEAARPGGGDSAPAVPDPGRRDVAATVVGAAADTEIAMDGAFTPALLAGLQAHPDMNIDDILRLVAAAPIAHQSGSLQHPTIVQYGQQHAKTAPQGSKPKAPQKHAVLVANKNYLHMNPLGTPILEAEAMKGELETRGYRADVHTDQRADEMGTLWSSMVGSAKPGDDLVAYYGGHGMPAGLAGIDHDQPPDIFARSSVAGVVSSATGKGAHIRFIMDSCYAGTAVQAVREEQHNALAEASSGTVGDELRVAAMTGLREAKQRLLAFREQRTNAYHQLAASLEHPRADASGAASAATTRDIGRYVVYAGPRIKSAVDRAADQMWAGYVPLLHIVRMAVRYAEEPPPISNYHTFAAQLNYLDDLWNAVAHSMENAATKPGKPAPAP